MAVRVDLRKGPGIGVDWGETISPGPVSKGKKVREGELLSLEKAGRMKNCGRRSEKKVALMGEK